MTPKQSEQALAKSMERLEAAQINLPKTCKAYSDALEELASAMLDVEEKQAALVAANSK
jgi:hypothetical protein